MASCQIDLTSKVYEMVTFLRWWTRVSSNRCVVHCLCRLVLLSFSSFHAFYFASYRGLSESKKGLLGDGFFERVEGSRDLGFPPDPPNNC